MHGRDRRLQRERAGSAAKRLLHQGQRFGDLTPIPAAAILLFENHKIAGLIETGVAPGVLQQHEGEQGGGFRRRLRAQSTSSPGGPGGWPRRRDRSCTSGPPRVAA